MIYLHYELLQKIKVRPGMWIGSNKLSDLFLFLIGYETALEDNNLIKNYDFPDPFHDWIANKYGFYESTAGWANMILAISLGLNSKRVNWEDLLSRTLNREQYKKSMDLFYELFEEYVKDEEIIKKFKN